MRYKNVGTSLFRFVTNHAFDGRTDGRTNRQTDSFFVARPVKTMAYAQHC